MIPAQSPGRGFLETEFSNVGNTSIKLFYTTKPQCPSLDAIAGVSSSGWCYPVDIVTQHG